MSLSPFQIMALQSAQNAQQSQQQQAQQQVPNMGQQAMALGMMQPDATGMYSGMTNASGALLGAALMKNFQQQNDPATQTIAQRYGMSPRNAANIVGGGPGTGGWLSNLFGLGGS